MPRDARRSGLRNCGYVGTVEPLETRTGGIAFCLDPVDQAGVDGESIVTMPAMAASIPMSRKVALNFNPGEALQMVEAVFTEIDRDRGLNLWPAFPQLAADHPQSPKASRVQTELAVDLDDAPTEAESTPVEAGDEPAPVVISEPKTTATWPTEIGGIEMLQAVTHKRFGQGVITELFPARVGKGNANVDFDGTTKIVPLSDLTPFEAGETPDQRRGSDSNQRRPCIPDLSR